MPVKDLGGGGFTGLEENGVEYEGNRWPVTPMFDNSGVEKSSTLERALLGFSRCFADGLGGLRIFMEVVALARPGRARKAFLLGFLLEIVDLRIGLLPDEYARGFRIYQTG